MIDIHLFGELRKYSEFTKATDDSVVYLEFIENETILDLIERMNIIENIGDVFINHKVVEHKAIIPHDNSRLSIFAEGMVLLCGGQHLKGHGYITKDAPEKMNYYNQ